MTEDVMLNSSHRTTADGKSFVTCVARTPSPSGAQCNRATARQAIHRRAVRLIDLTPQHDTEHDAGRPGGGSSRRALLRTHRQHYTPPLLLLLLLLLLLRVGGPHAAGHQAALCAQERPSRRQTLPVGKRRVHRSPFLTFSRPSPFLYIL